MKRQEETSLIAVPIHPDEMRMRRSIVNIPLPSGRYVTLEGPLGPKTMGNLHATLLICRDSLVEPDRPIPDWQI